MITAIPFGTTKKGEEITEYILKNENGMEVHVLNYGAVIKNIFVPDKDGNVDDVVLGYDDLAGYEINSPSHGAVVGRVGNRIGGGAFTIDGVTYQLDKNQAGNCLHGGYERYEFKAYDAVVNEEKNAVTLKRVSPHMEQGFPGNLDISITYALSEDNALSICYELETDRTTPANLTNHTYYNLKGCMTQDLTTHEVMIRSSEITKTDENLLPNGEILSIVDTPMDLREMTAFMDRWQADFEPLRFGKGFDHNYILEHVDGEPDAVVVEKETGRKMEMFTDMPGVQFYNGNWLDENETAKGGVGYKEYAGYCLETQFYPNSCNIPSFPDAMVYPGKKFESTTIYRFGIEK